MDVKEVRKIKVGLGENTIDKFIEESDILKNFPDKVEGILEENENNKKIFDVGIGEKVAIFFKKELYDARSQTENIKINNLKLEIEDFKNLKLKLEENGGVQIGRWIKVQQISDTNNKIYDLEEKLKKIEIKFLFYANGIKEFVKKYLLNEISLKDSKELEKIKENYKNYFKN